MIFSVLFESYLTIYDVFTKFYMATIPLMCGCGS